MLIRIFSFVQMMSLLLEKMNSMLPMYRTFPRVATCPSRDPFIDPFSAGMMLMTGPRGRGWILAYGGRVLAPAADTCRLS